MRLASDQSSTEKKWFIFDFAVVKGPFDTNDLQQGLSAGRFLNTDMVWCQGRPDWTPLAELKLELGSPVVEVPLDDAWYANVNGYNSGPHTLDQVTEHLKSKKWVGPVTLWTEGLTEWLPFYQIPTIVEAMNIKARKFKRVPFIGTVMVGNEPVTESLSLSEAGIGIKNHDRFRVGEVYSINVASPFLDSAIYAKAKAVYKNENDVGLIFTYVSAEGQNQIVDFIKKFNP